MKDPIQALLEGGAQRPGPAPAEVADLAARDDGALVRLGELVNGRDPRVRGGAAEALACLAERDPARVAPLVPELAMALEQEETMTRLGAHRALAEVARGVPESLDDDFDAVRLGVFDPVNADIRRCAALSLGRFGAGNPERGWRAFPHLAEALRRFHDAPRAADLMEGVALLARSPAEPRLRAEIWKAARKHEKHADAAVRALVEEIRSLVTPA